MNLSNEQQAFASDVAKLIQRINQNGYLCTLGEVHRPQEMADLYAKEGKGIHDSLHCKSLAIDLNLFDLDGNYLTDYNDYKKIGDIWEAMDNKNRWGGYFVSKYGGHIVDSDHFERNVK
jgi:hypothetical protein